MIKRIILLNRMSLDPVTNDKYSECVLCEAELFPSNAKPIFFGKEIYLLFFDNCFVNQPEEVYNHVAIEIKMQLLKYKFDIEESKSYETQ